ncbi:hypothetical protein BH20VER2_BH20VER2_01570 [soil metagenome]
MALPVHDSDNGDEVWKDSVDDQIRESLDQTEPRLTMNDKVDPRLFRE